MSVVGKFYIGSQPLVMFEQSIGPREWNSINYPLYFAIKNNFKLSPALGNRVGNHLLFQYTVAVE